MKPRLKSAFNCVIILVLAILTQTTPTYANGTLDLSFGVNGVATTPLGSIAYGGSGLIQPDGKIVVVGSVLMSGTGRDIALLRYNPNGSLDTSFGVGGTVVAAITTRDDWGAAVALQSNGSIVVVGSVQPLEGSTLTDFLIVRFTASGALDTTFGVNGVFTLNQGSTDYLSDVEVQPDGRIVAVGRTSDVGRAAIIRLNSGGSLDTPFGDGGFLFLNVLNLSNEYLSAVSVLPNGQILAGGRGGPATPSDPGVPNFLVKFNANGSLASEFGTAGVRVYSTGLGIGYGFDFAVLPDGKILSVGEGLFKLSATGTVESNTYPTGCSLAVRSDGKYVITNFPTSGASLTLFSKEGRTMGVARNLAGPKILVQPDDKIIVTRSTNDGFVVTRLVAITSEATRITDFDFDGLTDLTFYRPSNRTTYVTQSSNGTVSGFTANTDVTRVIPEGHNGDFIYWQDGTLSGNPAYFHLIDANNGNSLSQQWGSAGDIPVGGDYDGNSLTDFTVFRPSNGTWYITAPFSGQFRAVHWGTSGDQPVPADYDYDGITDIAVYRPSNGTWYVNRSSDGAMTAQRFGLSTDVPLTGDFDGDGMADYAVYRRSNGTWYLLQTTGGFRAVHFGLSTDEPVPGDYDGDGRHDVAVFRSGDWYILGSTSGFYVEHWGSANDVPVAVRYAY